MQSLWMLVASLLFACMGVCVKFAAATHSAVEITFYRSFISLILMFGLVRLCGVRLATSHWRWQISRGVVGFSALFTYFYAITLLPLATAVTLNYTSPLFLALILVFWAGERVRGTLYIALALGLAGVALLLRPSFEADQWLGGLAALASGAGAGLAYFHVRQLGRLGEPEWRTVFYFSLASALIGLPWLLASRTVHAVSGQGALLVLGVGGFGALAQLAMTRAYKRGSTLFSASLAYSTVIFASLFGVLLWDEALPLPAWLGIGLIVASGMLASAQSRAPAGQD